MNSIHQIHRFSKRYSIEDLRYACHGQAVPLVHICGLTTAEYSLKNGIRNQRLHRPAGFADDAKTHRLPLYSLQKPLGVRAIHVEAGKNNLRVALSSAIQRFDDSFRSKIRTTNADYDQKRAPLPYLLSSPGNLINDFRVYLARQLTI